jgi:hypothetical protein
MKRKKYLKIISTDSIGFLGQPEQFNDLYHEYFQKKIFDGVEVIAVKPLSRLKNIISTLEKNKIKVISLHGRTGGENQLPFFYRIMMTIVNKCLLNSSEILSGFPRQDILYHTPYSQNLEVEKMIVIKKPRHLILENHRIGKKGIEETIKQINFLRKKGINVSGLIDIYHFVYGTSTNLLKKNWLKIVKELEMYFRIKDENDKPFFNSVHFPIGTRISDSLPIEEITNDMLSLFSEKITPYLDRFVIENQVKNIGLIYLTKSMMERTKKRNKINIDRLQKAGLL